MCNYRVRILLLLLMLGVVPQVHAGGLPPWLPRYALDIHLDVAQHRAVVRQQATWTNHSTRSTDRLVFNVHSHYQVPKDQIGFMAKTLEVLRLDPREALETELQPFQLKRVTLAPPLGSLSEGEEVSYCWGGDTNTDLILSLAQPVAEGETISVVLEFEFLLPQKQGRWGQWRDVTYLSNWVPVFAVHDKEGWHPTPFVPWHQPFFNEAGIYDVRLTYPAEQKVGCTGAITARRTTAEGWQQVEIVALGVRDFALLCSCHYQEWTTSVELCADRPPVQVRILAFAEHEHYATEMLRIAREALTTYSQWFGPYPYPVFTITEAFFGWNGNECSTLVMIDERVFGMPHMAGNYVDYLVSHEILHQWFYNQVGTNGYCETWMDEAIVTHFTHKLMTKKCGSPNNELLKFPNGLGWLPNIHRQDYRAYGLYGTIARGGNTALVQEIPKFGHVVDLFSMIYDKGSRVVNMIEDRLGEAAFFDFMRLVFRRYQYRIIRVKDFQTELEQYTGRSWEAFFQNWLYGKGLSDWAIEKVKVERSTLGAVCDRMAPCSALGEPGVQCNATATHHNGPFKVTVLLEQKAEYTEDTTLGIALDKEDVYPIRIPIVPGAQRLDLEELNAVVQTLPDKRICVEVMLPSRPRQIMVDPDRILIDKNPCNNSWHTCLNWRVTPLYSFLDETDLTTAHDRWNVLAGPWISRPAYIDPWYTRSTIVGARAGLYHLQCFSGGVYAGYRSDYRDVVVGADGVLDHWPGSKDQLGFHVEQRLASFQNGKDTAFRGVLYARHIFKYTSSLYLQPMEYAESFATYQDNFLPFSRNPGPGAVRPDSSGLFGLHYRVNYLTPYWDPVGGMWLDLMYAGGVVDLDGSRSTHQMTGQFTMVKSLPDVRNWLDEAPRLQEHLGPALGWLADTRLAMRFHLAGGLPDQGEYFTMGGGNLFRGFDQAERQGSLVWVGSLEWRVPFLRQVEWDCCDHVVGVRNIYGALFYDVGNAYVNGHATGPIAHAVGAGLRLDLSWFSFVERSILRLDVAKTVNANTGIQFWFGIQHPF